MRVFPGAGERSDNAETQACVPADAAKGRQEVEIAYDETANGDRALL